MEVQPLGVWYGTEHMCSVFLTLCKRLYPVRLLCPGSRQEYWSCHALLQGSSQPRDRTRSFVSPAFSKSIPSCWPTWRSLLGTWRVPSVRFWCELAESQLQSSQPPLEDSMSIFRIPTAFLGGAQEYKYSYLFWKIFLLRTKENRNMNFQAPLLSLDTV